MIGEERSISESLDMSKLAEDLGFDFVWFGEHIGIRDALVMASLTLSNTYRIKAGTCAINVYTRNVGSVLAAANTIDGYAPGRFTLGIASGEEVLGQFGVVKNSPFKEMKEFLISFKELMTGEPVSFEGSLVKLKNARGERKMNIPVYVAATGPKLLMLGSKYADGVILNFLTTQEYISSAHSLIGGAKAFQLIAVSLNKSGSLDDAKKFLSKFFFLAPDFFKSLEIDKNVIDKARSKISFWPPSEESLERASAEIPDGVVRKLMAAGSLEEISRFVRSITQPWNSIPVFYIVSQDYGYALEELSKMLKL